MCSKIPALVRASAALCLWSSLNSLLAADAVPAPAATPAAATTPPAATPDAAAGRRGGGRGTPVPLSDEDKAELARFATFPAWKPGAGDGNYSIGPDYAPAPELTPRDGVPKGRVETFTFNNTESKFYADSGKSRYSPTRQVTVYIPSQYVAGQPAPFIVSCDAYGAPDPRPNRALLPAILDNMIADKRLPVMIAVMIANGGGDGPGSQRGFEYDTVSGTYAEFLEAEILPKVEQTYGVKLTKDPEGRMTLGGSSGGSAAFNMAWFHPEWYHRALIYSGTFVNQQSGPDAPHGAWSLHETIVPNSPAKPLRLWLHVSERDNRPTSGSASFGNWLLANIRMADVLKAKGYHYQFVYAKNAGHTDAKVISQTYPQALEWVWQGYKASGK
ncbi:MAG: alpha/beta hydrolase-fold protein [Opitutaceae bacterium]